MSLMSSKGGVAQACAACKYQRRRCTKDCPLAPYFPADQPKMFRNAHRLFGVANILKILTQVHKDLRDEAMRSIIYESDMRARFPVNGCREVIWRLQFQMKETAEELAYVKNLVEMCKQGHQFNYQTPREQLQLVVGANVEDNPVQEQDYMGVDYSIYDHHPTSVQSTEAGNRFYFDTISSS